MELLSAKTCYSSVGLYFSGERKIHNQVLLVSVIDSVSPAQSAVLLRAVSLICRDSGEE